MTDYADNDVFDFLQFGWPINYNASVLPKLTHADHHSALAYPEDVQNQNIVQNHNIVKTRLVFPTGDRNAEILSGIFNEHFSGY